MPATTPTVLGRLMDALAENLATIQVIGGGDQLFGGDGTPANWNVPDSPARGSRIYFLGEPAPKGGPSAVHPSAIDPARWCRTGRGWRTTSPGSVLSRRV